MLIFNLCNHFQIAGIFNTIIKVSINFKISDYKFAKFRKGSIISTMRKSIAGILCALISSQVFGVVQRSYVNVEAFDEESEVPQSLFGNYSDDFYRNEESILNLTLDQWYRGPHALGNLWGVRTVLDDYGITPLIGYLGNFAANPWGGDSHGATNTSSVHLGVGIDLAKLVKSDSLEGWSIGNTWVWRFGESLTKRYIHNAFNVQQNYGSQTIRLQSLYAVYSREIPNTDLRFTLKFGRIAAGDNFLTKPIYWLYQSNSIDGNPVGIFNQLKWSAYPGSTWGAYSQIKHSEGQYFRAGVYQINSDRQDSMGMHGLDWSFSGADGVNANFELGWDINHDDSGESPGNISAGFAADWYNAQYVDNSGRSKPFNCTMYAQADYMIFNLGQVKTDDPRYIKRSEDSYRDLRGIVLWGIVQYDPYEELARMPWFASGGLLFNAPFTSRADDVLCLGFSYGKFSSSLDDPDLRGSYEIAVELNYKFQINRFSFVQPGVQFIVNTGGGEYPNAVVFGLQYGLSL